MSIASGRSSHVSLVRRSLQHRKSLALNRIVYDEKTVRAALDRLSDGDPRPCEDLARSLRDASIVDDEFRKLLKGCESCVCSMGPDTGSLVEALFSLNWPAMSEETARAFSEWTLTLLSAQICHTTVALNCLTKLLGKSTSTWIDDPPQEQLVIFSNVHQLIAKIVIMIPLSGEILIQRVIDNFPYYKQSIVINRAYVHNVLWMARYLPTFAGRLLSLVFNRLIVMDVHLRSQDSQDDGVFQMDMDENPDELVECLDSCMMEVFKWMNKRGASVLDILFSAYKSVILPTHGTSTVQFVILYGLSLDKTRINEFLDSLWQFVASVRAGQSLRQASVVHMTGFLARASYVSVECLKLYLMKIAEWCHSYVKAHEVQNTNYTKNPHSVFYCVSQSLFYLIAFNQKALFCDRKGIVFVESLNLPKIVMSSLNPLRFCHLGIAETFTSVTRMHQIVYCHTVMEHNFRHYLQGENHLMDIQEWFPFDPYTLPKSCRWIESIYKKYDDSLSDKLEKRMDLCEEDDFLATSPHFSSRSLNSLR